MRTGKIRAEDLVLLGATGAILVAGFAAEILREHVRPHNERVAYGLWHLPLALFGIAAFWLLAGAVRWMVAGRARLHELPSIVLLGTIAAVFTACWLPVLLGGGFAQDDWMLLAAASIRKSVYLHPGYSWFALDTMDGNFRPLGTVLYFGYMLRWFVENLLGCIVAYWIVLELGYGKVAGTAAALLFMTRGMIYTIVAWTCALGDGLVILLCGLMALMILKANKARFGAAVCLHLLAWFCFLLATLAKQSAFAAPAIVGLLLFLRPGQALVGAARKRFAAALVGMFVYGATAAAVFLHAKSLSRSGTPYPIGFSIDSALRMFSYVSWYLVTFTFPDRQHVLNLLPPLAGAAIVFSACAFVWRGPALLGDRARDVAFAVLAGLASLSLFLLLGTRSAGYYGSMFAFWLSIALAIVLTRPASKEGNGMTAGFRGVIFFLLVLTGFADIRLKQTGLVPSGGYIWGTYGMDREQREFAELQASIEASPHSTEVMLEDFSSAPSSFASMVLLTEPQIQRILAYDSSGKTYLANDLEGHRPTDDLASFTDRMSYNWLIPMGGEHARELSPPDKTLWLAIRDDRIERVDAAPADAGAGAGR
jgi:hypothetical protein